MRRAAAVLSILALIACAKTQTAQTDSAAAAPAPAALTDADFAGTWQGTLTAEGSDSVIVHWTQVCAAGTCRGTTQEAPGDTAVATYRIDADSSIGVTGTYVDATISTAPIIDNWVARVSGASVTGHGWAVLADRPDSVVFRYRFTGTRSSS